MQSWTENSMCCHNLSAGMKRAFMAPEAREERESNVRLSRARVSAVSAALTGRQSMPDDHEVGRPSAAGIGPWGNERLTAISQRLSAAGQRPSAARTICDP